MVIGMVMMRMGMVMREGDGEREGMGMRDGDEGWREGWR